MNPQEPLSNPVLPVDLAALAAVETKDVSHSPESCSIIEPDQSEAVPFFCGKERQVTVIRESPVHRVMCTMRMQGMQVQQIAEVFGKSVATVSTILNQPWAQEFMAGEIHKAANAVECLLKGEALKALEKLVELRDDKQAAKETQRKAANDILDRAFGKPNQPIEHTKADVKDWSDEALEQFLAKKN